MRLSSTNKSKSKYKIGDVIDFKLATGEKVQALAVKEIENDMLFILYDCLNKEYTMNEILIDDVLDKIYETFPSDIKSLMKPFDSGYLRLPTEKEIFGCNKYGEDEGDEVEQFEPMKLRRNRIASQGLNGNYEWWWLANKTVASGSFFASVTYNGYSYYNYASGASGVRPLFLIKNSTKKTKNILNNLITLYKKYHKNPTRAFNSAKKVTGIKTWEEFEECGMLWWINMILHTFGWTIVLESENKVITGAYPARVKYRGFSEKCNTNGYIKVSNYMKENAEILERESCE